LKYKTEVWFIGIICWNKNRILVYSKLSVIKNRILVYSKLSVIKNRILVYSKLSVVRTFEI